MKFEVIKSHGHEPKSTAVKSPSKVYRTLPETKVHDFK